MTVVAAVCVALAALVVCWPVARRRARLRRLLGGTMPPAPRHRRGGRRRPNQPGGSRDAPGWTERLRTPGRAPLALLVVAGMALAAVLGGVVASGIAGAYGLVAAGLVMRRGNQRSRVRHRVELLDLLSAAAADLRAGLPPDTAIAAVHTGPADPLRPRVAAAVRLAEQTGAPLADVIERIEADARSTDRARASAAAQAAGSRATAWLLAGLPVGGLALGYAIGADPLAVLLYTPIGAACAAGAVTLQLAGLAWAGRITRAGAAVTP